MKLSQNKLIILINKNVLHKTITVMVYILYVCIKYVKYTWIKTNTQYRFQFLNKPHNNIASQCKVEC